MNVRDYNPKKIYIYIMAKRSVISYNCKGFNVSKVPCIKILLDRWSVLLSQETWLFYNQFTQFTKYFDKYKSINICGMDESIFCHGGCSILYSGHNRNLHTINAIEIFMSK